MSRSDRPGELPLFRDAAPESAEASIPSWRPTVADTWFGRAPSRGAVEAQGEDLLCRGLEFLEAVKRARVGPDEARLQQFRERQEGLARALAEWPDVGAGDDEATDAAGLVEATVDELATLRRRILQALDPKARGRVLAAERRASREPREVDRIRSLAQFLLAEARGDVVEVRLSPSFLSESAIPEGSSSPERSSKFLGPADVDALVRDHLESMKAEQEDRPLPARGGLATLLASIPVVWLDAVWTALDLGPERPRHRKERERRIARHLTQGDVLRRIVGYALSSEEGDLLAYLLERDGRAPIGSVTRRYGSDRGDGWFWNEEPPTSILGRVRLHGLAFVGVDASSGRRMRTVLVPRELRDGIREALDQVPDPEREATPSGTGTSGRRAGSAPGSGGPELRSDVRWALEDAFPGGVLEPLWFDDSWLANGWNDLRKALAGLRDAAVLYERPPLEPTDWSFVIDDEGDEDDFPAWEEPGWDDQERSYGIFFVGPEGEGFRFEFDSEFPDDEGRLQPVEGVGRIGWVVAVSAVGPFALLRVRSLDTEDGMVLPPDIEQRLFDDEGRPQSEALFLREMLDERENRALDDLRERIVEALATQDVATLSDEEVAVRLPWLEASEEVLVARGPESSISVEDALFFRWI